MVARTSTDYYAVLGVPRDADDRTIKQAFRALARELHPDVSTDPRSRDLFHEVREAYEVLSSRELRDRYDRFGRVSWGRRRAGAPGPFDDLFERAAGAGRRGEDVVLVADVDFVDSARGASRGVRYTVLAQCGRCRGEGVGKGGASRSCSSCAGTGRVREAGGAAAFRSCARCRGTGRLVTSACAECDGLGRVEEERTILVRIPQGVQDGQRIRLAAEGHAGAPGAEPGDVFVEVRVAPAPDDRTIRLLAAAGVVCAIVLLVLMLVS